MREKELNELGPSPRPTIDLHDALMAIKNFNNMQIVSVTKAMDQLLAIAMSSSTRCGVGSPARLAAVCGPLLRDSLGLPWVLRPSSWLCARVTPVPSTNERRGCGYLAVLVSATLGALGDPVVSTSLEYQRDYWSEREWVSPTSRMAMLWYSRVDRWFAVRDVLGRRRVVHRLTQDPDLRDCEDLVRKVDCGFGEEGGFHLYDCNSKWVLIVGGVGKTTIHVWKVPPSSFDLHQSGSTEDLSCNDEVFTVREFPTHCGLVWSVKLGEADKVSIMCEEEHTMTKHSDLMWIQVDIAESLETGVLVSSVVVKWNCKVSSKLREKKARVFWSGLLITAKNELLAPSGDVVVTLPSKPWLLDHIHFACIANSSEVNSTSKDTRVLIFKLSQPTQPFLSVSLATPEFPIARVSVMGSLVTVGVTEKGALVMMFCDPWSGRTVLKARFLAHQLTDTLNWSATLFPFPLSSN
ncbi:hypothetical protein Pelo_9266 [Pelomyxa schiedti]|nr:hypothetical protein Pelo_9266 [Pelomyxa schiedti]